MSFAPTILPSTILPPTTLDTAIEPRGRAGLSSLQRRLSLRQKRRKLHLWGVGVLIALLSLVVQSAWVPGTFMDDSLEAVGAVLILFCGLGRAWSILYIGGRKTRELVRQGPYSLTRNSLYLFTLVGVFGLGLQIGSVTAGCIYLAVTLAVFLPVIRSEERALAERFGAEFQAYRRDVPMLLPRFAGWRDTESFNVAPAQLYKSARDSFVLLAIIPLFDFIDLLQAHGLLPVLLRLW